MTDFDLIDFLQSHNIFYRTSGKNCKKGQVVVDCPFCIKEGRGDDGQHMGIDPKTGAWGCWRSSDHRGRSYPKILSELSGMSFGECAALLKDEHLFKGNRTFDDMASELVSDFDRLSFDDDTQYHRNRIAMPKQFRKLTYKRSTAEYYEYLLDRGFSDKDLDDLIEAYNLHYSTCDDWKRRLIIPVNHDGHLVSWTGRAIDKWVSLRYKSLEVAKSAKNIYDCLLTYDDILETGGGDTLFIVEGPLDCMKVDFYGRDYGCRAVALFTKIMSDDQLVCITEISDLFSKVVVLLDPEEEADMLKIVNQLSHVSNVSYHKLGDGIEDPGAMTKRQVVKMCRKFN